MSLSCPLKVSIITSECCCCGNPKRKKKPPLINETPKLESDSEGVNPKRKTKPLLINETQEDDRFVIDEDYDIVIEK